MFQRFSCISFLFKPPCKSGQSHQKLNICYFLYSSRVSFILNDFICHKYLISVEYSKLTVKHYFLILFWLSIIYLLYYKKGFLAFLFVIAFSSQDKNYYYSQLLLLLLLLLTAPCWMHFWRKNYSMDDICILTLAFKKLLSG